MIRLLLLGCGSSASINFIKALRLGKEKIYIVGVDLNKYYLEMSPVNKRYLLKRDNDKNYVDNLIKIIKKEKIDFVHAQPDPEVRILSEYRDILPAKTFLPSKEAVLIFQDKLSTFDCLKKNKIHVADTTHITSEKVLKDLFKKNKETLWIRSKRGAAGKASLPVDRFDQAKMWIEYWTQKGLDWSDFLAHEFLPGREISWLSIWKNGELVCSQSKERVEWIQSGVAPSGVSGTTAIQKTVCEEKINEIGIATIRAVDKKANGVYVVDTKEDKKGKIAVTEVNPGRFFTTSLFFATAGCNMPLIYLKLGMGLPIDVVSSVNCVEKDIYWIRIPDGGPTMMIGENWTSELL